MDLLSAQSANSDYLSLLTIQLQNQDPIDPVDQEGLLGDLTQFSILEGIQELNASFEEIRQLQEISQGLDLVGKQVQFINAGSGNPETGTVEQLLTSENEIRIFVNNKSVAVADILAIGDNVSA